MTAVPMMPHEPRILPPMACPHCGSTAGVAYDEHGAAYCQDCDQHRHVAIVATVCQCEACRAGVIPAE